MPHILNIGGGGVSAPRGRVFNLGTGGAVVPPADPGPTFYLWKASTGGDPDTGDGSITSDTISFADGLEDYWITLSERPVQQGGSNFINIEILLTAVPGSYGAISDIDANGTLNEYGNNWNARGGGHHFGFTPAQAGVGNTVIFRITMQSGGIASQFADATIDFPVTITA